VWLCEVFLLAATHIAVKQKLLILNVNWRPLHTARCRNQLRLKQNQPTMTST